MSDLELILEEITLLQKDIASIIRIAKKSNDFQTLVKIAIRLGECVDE